jgi:hypothetical protein
LTLSVNSGETLYIRVYGWGANNQNLYFMNKNVIVSGEEEITDPTILVSPSSLDFGYNANGTTSSELSYNLSGYNLDGSAITIEAPTGFEISTNSGGTFSSSLSIAYTTGATLSSTPIYVRFSPTTEDNYAGNISITDNGSAESKQVSVNGSTYNYCSSYGNTSYDDCITLVNINTINNSTVDETKTGYTYYTSLSTDLIVGYTYSLTVNVNTDGKYTNYTYAWIDWDSSGEFDSDEEYDLGSAYNVTDGKTDYSSLSITIPSDASPGTIRMRVSTKYSSYPTSCEEDFDGEVEDYSLNIISACNDATLTLNSGNSTQSLCVNESIDDIEYAVGGGASSATASGLPTGVTGSYNSGIFTISGTPTENGTFEFTVTTSGTSSGCSEANLNGTITALNLPNAPTATNITTTYNGAAQSASASVESGETMDWYTTESGSTTSVAPSGTNVGTYSAWAEARNTSTDCVSTSRTEVTVVISKADLQVTATTSDITYGDTEPAVSIQYTGFEGSDDETALDNT